MQKYDVVALGELLVDFTENGMSSQENMMFEANPGGAPCNVLSMLQRLGKKTAFIGKVGNDNFGRMLRRVVKEQGIETDNIIFDDVIHTTLAFVHTKEDGDREFSFYRNPGADMMLRKSEINESLLENTKIFHFGTLSMTEEKIAETTKYAVEKAKGIGAVISFDPNFRPPLWDDFEKAKEQMWYGISKCDILKISDDEISFLTGEDDIEAGVKKILGRYKPALLCATQGKNGSTAYYKGKSFSRDAFLRQDTVETTGAGDTFMACVLNIVLEKGLDSLTENDISYMLEFASAAASIITTKKGALKVMPQKDDVIAFLNNNK